MSSLLVIVRSLYRFHKLLAGIIVLEYALTFAIIMVSISVLFARLDALIQPAGIDGRHVYVLQGRGIDGPVHRYQIHYAERLFAGLPGKEHLSIASSVPFLGSNSISVLVGALNDAGSRDRADPIRVNAYRVDSTFTQTLGVNFVHGRNFLSSEIVRRFGDTGHVIILSQSLAHRLFHDNEAVGRQVNINGRMVTVVGVIAPLAAPNYLGDVDTTYTALLPKMPTNRSVLIIRYTGSNDKLYNRLAGLAKHDAGKINWSLWPYSTIRSDYFRSDRTAALALGGVVVIVIITALCGLVGLTSYWIAQRRPQIAIRRALGAKKSHVTTYFLLEGLLLVGVGLVFGWFVEIFLAKYFGVLPFSGDARIWLVSILFVAAMAIVTVFVSLRRWLRLDPASLMRAM